MPVNQSNPVSKVPILMLVFNRLEHTKKVFASVRSAAPSRLYISCDGPRPDKPGEKEKVMEVRDYLNNSVDWPCEVKTLYRDSNLGCELGVSGGINWFFEHEEMGIVIEDDCVPSKSFYSYCGELLNRYKDDTRIWMISGFNPMGEYSKDASYFFTHFGFCWGWATWRRAWKHFDVEMRLWPIAQEQGITKSYPFFPQRNQEFEDTYQDKLNTWDYQWYFTIASNGGLSAVPVRNLVKNIGFDAEATHTVSDAQGRGKIENQELGGQLIHPPFVFYDKAYEDTFLKKALQKPSIARRIINKVRNL